MWVFKCGRVLACGVRLKLGCVESSLKCGAVKKVAQNGVRSFCNDKNR